MNKSYLQGFISDLVETLPEHLSLQLHSNLPGASSCYNLKCCIPEIQLETGGHYSIVRFGLYEGTINVSLCVLQNAKHAGRHLITGIDLTALAVCHCNRVDDNYLHLFCDPYAPEYPPMEFLDIPSVN